MAKKLLKTERFLLENQGPNYVSYRCAVHGIFQKRKDVADGMCTWSTCTAAVQHIADPIAYEKAN